MSFDPERILDRMTDDELVGQLLCYEVGPKMTAEKLEEYVKATRPGGIFVHSIDAERIKLFTDIVNKYSSVPVIVSADVENGPGSAIPDETLFPSQMAWGACDDEELIERAGESIAKVTRKAGIHWTFSPVVDLNINPNNPVVNIRAISDSPRQVAKIATAYIRGSQKNGMLMTTAKHFPGDGTDDRNQHFCTTVNSMTLEEWRSTYGYVYKETIKSGVAAIMSAHIAFPAFDGECRDSKGYLPATLSKRLQTELLRNELGFDGVIVSDAFSMVGVCAMEKREKQASEFVKAGGDMVLFALPEDFDYLKAAVSCGDLPRERLVDAVRRILMLKNKARLFEDQEKLMADISDDCSCDALSDEIGEKSVKVIRNFDGLIPLSLRKGARILLVNLQKNSGDKEYIRSLDTVKSELEKRGYETEVLINPGHYKIKTIKDDFDCILINCRISSNNFTGGSLRLGWEQIYAFWRGYILEHPCVIFTSFGDPYKIYEVPFMKTCINTFCCSESSQRAFVRVLLGEIKPTAKSPVSLKGYFEREVE